MTPEAETTAIETDARGQPSARFVADAGLHVVEVTGAERLSFLDAVLTNKLDDAVPGQVLGALELEQHGSALLVADVVVLDDRVLLLVPAARPREDTPPPMTPPGREPPPMPDLAASTVARLGSRTFLTDARFARRDDLAVLLDVDAGVQVPEGATRGPRGAAVVVGDADVSGLAAPGDLVVLRDGSRLVVTDTADAFLAAATARGVAVLDAQGRDRWLVANGEPRWGHELVAPHLPEELGLLPTHVHLGKGCYPGQEAVARMWLLGRPRRRLARVTVDGEVPTPPLEVGSGRNRVTVGGLVGDGTGLAHVPGSAAAGDTFATDDGGVTVTVLDVLGDDPAPPGHDPGQARRRDTRAPRRPARS